MPSMMKKKTLVAALVASLLHLTSSLVHPPCNFVRSGCAPLAFRSGGCVHQSANPSQPQHARLSSSALLLSPSEIADTGIDPVVVGASFMSTVRGKIVSAIIGNILGGLFFATVGGAVATFGASKLPQLFGDKEEKESKKGEGGGESFGFDLGGIFGKNEQDESSSASALSSTLSSSSSSSSSSSPSATAAPTSTSESASTSASARASSPVTRSLLTPATVSTLLVSILLDLLGDSSYALPFLGDASDVLFAPISGIILYKLYGSNVVTALNVVEELLPGADFIPTGTLAWYCKNVLSKDNKLRSILGFSDAVDVEAEVDDDDA